MSDVRIMIELPEALVERAKAVGLQLAAQQNQIIALLEAQICRREAVQRITAIAAQLQSLPPELKPTSEEIEAEIQAHWDESSR